MEYCQPIVIAPNRNGAIILCLDLTKLNSSIERELYQLESVDETLAKIGNNCHFMTKLDANSDYWQVPLEKDIEELCKVITPFGRYCPTRGPFGLSSMPEIFNK